ncbi:MULTISPECIES: DUF2712 domain-containing protein [Neobacillus]|jgi:hypothetical protein|uniref:DUF2712 domain-containing protein n=1 Tax=Neobacillus sedimentimangrovi TaxID=2699460 RepID=A0ABS8QKT4_9BACI|nr:DUF2712 domain-containing protein [Neobacillus sedimentimangrovi]MCD4839645.1 DUF2712 domain-containing protein [Neobacillus sedimentimangrovi]
MRNIVKKYSRLGMAAAMGVGIFTFSNFTYASDDNIGFSFTLKPNYENSYSGERYRQTTNPKNKWKVNLTYSSEGVGTVATFWLDKSGTRVSDVHDVAQGSGAHYYSAFSTANQSNVRLGAENNNASPNSYTISGYWDEETD